VTAATLLHRQDQDRTVAHWGHRLLGRYGTLVGVTIRLRRSDDLPACVEVLAEIHRQDGYPTRWPKDPARWLDSPGLLGAWVAEEEGIIDGHIALIAGVDDAQLIAAAGRPAAELAMVSRLFVGLTARGRQLGEGLVSTATQFGSSRGLGLVLVEEGQRLDVDVLTRSGGNRGRRPWRCTSGWAGSWLGSTRQTGRRPQAMDRTSACTC